MYIPNPYFPNVPGIGDLILGHIIIADGYPILFVCRNETKLYLCVCRTTHLKQKWALSETTFDILEAMARREISIAEAFRMANGVACIAIWSKENPVERYTVFPTSQLEDENLPDRSCYLHEDYADDLLKYINLGGACGDRG